MRIIAAPGFESLLDCLVREIERARSEDPLRPLDVVTPGDLAREETRRALARRGGSGLFGVAVRTLGSWIREIAAPEIAAAGGRRLSEPGFERLVARVLEERASRPAPRARPGALSELAQSPGLARSIATSLQNLLQGRILPRDLDLGSGGSARAIQKELGEIYREFLEEVSAAGLYDRRREERIAARRLGEAAPREEALFVFGFHDLTALQRDVVRACSQRRPVTLLLPGPGGPGDTAAESLLGWARAHASHFEAHPDPGSPLLTIQEGLFQEPSVTDPGGEALRLATYPNESAEVRGIARTIRQEVERNERSFDDFLITTPAAGPSPRLFRRIFEKAGIPLADRAGIPAPQTEGGRRALTLARALSARGNDRDREALAFLAGGRAPESDSDEAPDRDPVYDDPVTLFTRAASWEDAVERFAELYHLQFGEDVSPEVRVALDSLALVFGARPNRPRDFAPSLSAALSTLTHRTRVRTEAQDARVLLVRMEAARGLTRPVVFHAGLVEGAVRRSLPEDPFLPDRIREDLNLRREHEGRFLPLRQGTRVERLLLARFALESSRQIATLSWARRERTGAEARNPSGLLLDLASRRAGASLEPGSAEFLAVAPPPSNEERRARPVDRTDLELALLTGASAPGTAELSRLVAGGRSPDLLRALRAAESRWRAGSLTVHDGVLTDAATISAVTERIESTGAWSPTALETLANCPFSFLVEHVLHLRAPRDEQDDYDPMRRGIIFHEILEVIYGELHEHRRLPLRLSELTGALRMLDDLIGGYRRGLHAEEPGRRAHREATLASLRNDVAIVLALDAHRPVSDRAIPIHFELAFGPGSRTPPAFALDDGTLVPLRGKADRVDLRDDGTIEIIDLKTGAPRMANGAITSVEEGKTVIRLQLPMYLEAVSRTLGKRGARATYYHATADHGFREIEFTASDLERRRPDLSRLLRHLLELPRRGWFPCTPGSTCCRPELAPACGPGVAARFRRKASATDLEDHLRVLRELDNPEREP